MNIMNQNGPRSSTPPPPRGVPTNNSGGTIRRPPSASSDFIDITPAERRYDHEFEARFRFTPLENLPSSEAWQPQPSQNKSSKHVNAT
jgi:hypothetical protein